MQKQTWVDRKALPPSSRQRHVVFAFWNISSGGQQPMGGRAVRCQSPRSTYTRSKCLILTVKKPPCNRKRAQGPHWRKGEWEEGGGRRKWGACKTNVLCVMRGGLQREGVSQGKCNEQETGRRMGVHSYVSVYCTTINALEHGSHFCVIWSNEPCTISAFSDWLISGNFRIQYICWGFTQLKK